MELAKIRVCLNEAGRLEHRHSSSEFGSVQGRKLEFPLFEVSISGAWISDRRLYKDRRIRLVSLRVCRGPQQARLFASYTAARKF
jgi:hypothetical protein